MYFVQAAPAVLTLFRRFAGMYACTYSALWRWRHAPFLWFPFFPVTLPTMLLVMHTHFAKQIPTR